MEQRKKRHFLMDFEEAGEPDMVATMEEVETHDEGPTKGADGE